MKVLVTGSTGLVGSAVVSLLKAKGHDVVRLVRSASKVPAGASTVSWDPAAGSIDRDGLQGLDGVVHLAGESIATRWTEAKKRRIRDSRTRGTETLCGALAALEAPPGVLASASAIGFYGDRGDEVMTESSASGEGFLAEVCRDWEEATKPAEDKGVRVVRLRIGMVLSKDGGALASMLPPFRLGLGGRIGNGKQYMSWIAIDDLAAIILRALEDGELRGPVNAVAPEAVTNNAFTKTLGRVLSRPTIFPMPGFMSRVIFGEMAEELLLASTRVDPEVLRSRGHDFLHPELEGALRHLLK